MITEKTKVERNKPSVTRVIRERMKIRTVLGEYWLAASWMATSVVANTTATKAKVAAAVAPAGGGGGAGTPPTAGRPPPGASTWASSHVVRLARTIAATAKMVGRNHNDTAIRWRKSVRHNGSGDTGSALMNRKSVSPGGRNGASAQRRPSGVDALRRRRQAS